MEHGSLQSSQHRMACFQLGILECFAETLQEPGFGVDRENQGQLAQPGANGHSQDWHLHLSQGGGEIMLTYLALVGSVCGAGGVQQLARIRLRKAQSIKGQETQKLLS